MSFDLWNNQADVADPRAVFAAQQQAASQPKQNTNTKGKGSFISHLLPTIGGTAGGVGGGALGGALAGSAILPGIGTAAGGLIGALLGGFAGGAGGKAVENQVEGQGTFNGVLGQGLEQGALSAGPIRLLKGATLGTKAAIDVAKDGGGLAGAINAMGDKATTSLIKTQAAKTGNALKGEARGIKPGITPKGGQPLTPAQSDEINQYLNSLGTKNSAHTQVRVVENDLNNTGQQIGNLVKQNDRVVRPNELQSIHASGDAAASKAIGLNPESQVITDTKNQINGAIGNLSKLHEVRQNIDNTLKNFYKQTDRNNSTTAEMQVLKGYRDGIDKVLTKAVPGFKDVNTRYALGLKARDLLLKNANPDGLRFFGIKTGVGGEGLQATKDLTGRVLQKVGTNSEAKFNPLSIPARTVPVGMLQAGNQASSMNNNMAATNPNQDTSNLNTTAMTTNNNIGNTLPQNGNMSSTAGDNSPYGQENLMYDISRDPANAAKYISTYESLQKVFNPTPAGSTGPKPTAQQASLAGSAMDSIQKIGNMIQQDPGVVSRNSTPGQGLPVVGGLIQHAAGTTDYHTEAANLAQAMLHLQTGAAFSNAEKQAVEANMPRLGDSPEAIQNKLSTLEGFLSRFQGSSTSAPNTTGSVNQTDLASALAAMGYGQ